MNKNLKNPQEKANLGMWEQEIAFSQSIEFRPGEKKLMMKIFELSLNERIKRAKKSHRIKLICLWKNLGCYKKGEEKIKTTIRIKDE